MEFIRKIIKEELSKINEVSNQLHNVIKNNYVDKRITISKDDNLKFKENKNNQTPGPKPVGLWYGIGSSWIDYIKSNNMNEWDYDNAFELILDDNKLLKITNVNELDNFTKIYVDTTNDTYLNNYFINWDSVAEKYSGIEIAPYIWKGRMKYMWYYGWDVASGCIWSKDVIKNVIKINN